MQFCYGNLTIAFNSQIPIKTKKNHIHINFGKNYWKNHNFTVCFELFTYLLWIVHILLWIFVKSGFKLTAPNYPNTLPSSRNLTLKPFHGSVTTNKSKINHIKTSNNNHKRCPNIYIYIQATLKSPTNTIFHHPWLVPSAQFKTSNKFTRMSHTSHKSKKKVNNPLSMCE